MSRAEGGEIYSIRPRCSEAGDMGAAPSQEPVEKGGMRESSP